MRVNIIVWHVVLVNTVTEELYEGEHNCFGMLY